MPTVVFTGAVSGDLSVGSNWDTGTVPGAGDDVVLKDCSRDITAGLDTTADTFATVKIYPSFTGAIGLPGSGGYWKLHADDCEIDYRVNKHIKLDFGTVECDTVVHNAGSGLLSDGKPVLLILADDVETDITVNSGSVGLAWNEETETSSVKTFKCGNVAGSAPIVFTGIGATVITATYSSGTATHKGISTTVTVKGGTATLDTTDDISVVNIEAGTLYADRHGTIGTLNLNGGLVDWLRTQHVREVTLMYANPNPGATGRIRIDPDFVTIATLSPIVNQRVSSVAV